MGHIIKVYGDDVLRKVAREISEVNDNLVTLAQDMFETMFSTSNGVGLAAPQVGVSKRLVVLDPPGGMLPRMALFNPKIIARESSQTGEEACLSVPGVSGNVKRDYWVKVSGVTLAGEEIVFDAEGFDARLIQHEIDHLNGVLFVDLLNPLKRKLLDQKLRKLSSMQKEQQELPPGGTISLR